MLVLGPGHDDARVLRSARALTEAGADVRVFALATSRFPAGVVQVQGVQVERLVVRTVLQRVLATVHVLLSRVRGTSATGPGRAPAAARTGPGVLHRVGVRLPEPLRRALRRALRPFRRGWTPSAFRAASTAAALAFEPDVVHAHDLATLPAARRVADARGIPVVYDSRRPGPHRDRTRLLIRLGRLRDRVLERRLAPAVDAVIAATASTAAWLDRTYWLRRPARVVRDVPEPSTASFAERARAADEVCWEREQLELLACYREIGVDLAPPVDVVPARVLASHPA